METVLQGAEIIQIEIGLFLESTQISVLFSFYCNQERAQMQWKRTGQDVKTMQETQPVRCSTPCNNDAKQEFPC